MTDRKMRIEGARTHNLKNLHLEIPLNSFVVVTGKSGSGKSSLAIDTIFAEGQRQYIESLSLYARNFFPVSDSIDVDSIAGLQPTVCIGQRRGTPNLRSTVGTLTEIYDSLRLLMAKVGKATCPGCGNPVTPLTPQQICTSILSLPNETKCMILAPMVRGRKGKHVDVFETIRKERLVRVRVDGELHDIERLPEISAAKLHDIEAVTDRIIVRDGIGSRLLESVESAARMGAGMVLVSSKSPTNNEWTDVLFSSHAGCPDCNIEVPLLEPRLFSFNSPYGACEKCNGIGRNISFMIDRVIPDRGLSIEGGALAIFAGRAGDKKFVKGLQSILDKLKIDQKTKLADIPVKNWNEFLHSDDPNTPGLLLLLEKVYSTCTDEDELDRLEQFRGSVVCSMCSGSRLNQKANSVLINGKTISNLSSLAIGELLDFIDNLELANDESQIASQILPQIQHRIRYLLEVGLDYLSLDRSSDSLSGGELQRVRLATAIGSGLSGTCYVLDEPSVGMHERDTERLIKSLRNLQERGNSLIIVEHDETLMREADHIVDLGPGAGVEGGEIVGQGNCQQLSNAPSSVTGAWLAGREQLTIPDRNTNTISGNSIKLFGASGFNLKSVDVEFPLGQLICVTGVSGSGKSSLINGTLAPLARQHLGLMTQDPLAYKKVSGLEKLDKLVNVDQRPISRSPRGCAATYTGILEDIRKIYAATKTARQRGFTASRFSFNSKSGRCPECEGHGVKKISMRFMSDMSVPCTVCHGDRYNSATLGVKFRNHSIADVLKMSVNQALEIFDSFERLKAKLVSLQQVGLGYLSLGQASTTLSGGEAQRIKLSLALATRSNGNTLYMLDEPTNGLHAHDVQMIVNVLCGIVDRGNTVIVIEHNLDLIQAADWIIDMGPSGGKLGGEVLVQGTAAEIIQCERSDTGRMLAKRIKKDP